MLVASGECGGPSLAEPFECACQARTRGEAFELTQNIARIGQLYLQKGLPSNLVDDLQRNPFRSSGTSAKTKGSPSSPPTRRCGRYQAFYNRLVEAVDRQIGTVLDAVEQSKVPSITVFSTITATSAARTGFRTKGNKRSFPGTDGDGSIGKGLPRF
jgi:hypothetical protein